ncbi:dipeptidase PepV [Floricoccus tropicus]|uniref:Dipeptidase PepV n=1 Tax=Floricoccus tropicus TaxID=1859473 RepID=A0A1E8GQ50_9LACT|nr:dipeptidase PepV [Floricoccus tropicus]OFI50359.1 dipeptidase PepV [Floricoccus tropicus]
MSINFKEEIEKRKDDMLEDLFTLLRINSERDDSKATKEAPFGPGPVEALDAILGLAERDGYATKNVDNYAGHFEYGEGDEVLGIFAHMDVVPAGSGWDSNPYEPEIRDGKIYARGSSDDKGPTMACYYGLKVIKELGLPVSKKVRFVIGTDEESGWGDMDYYFEHVGVPKPDFGFSPDAEFPIINGEKGNVTEYLHFDGINAGTFRLHSFNGGLRENMVPESATAVVTSILPLEDIQEAFETFKNEFKVGGEIKDLGEDKFEITVVGKSAHGASPHTGVNGATYLAHFLSGYDFQGGPGAFINIAGKTLFQDHDGKKLGVAYTDEKMGALSMNAGVFKFDENSDDNTIALNFRFPKGTDENKIKEVLVTLDGVEKVTLTEHIMPPHYVPMDDPLVKTLLDVYEKHTGQEGYEQIIGGGTFGRLLERGVAYGAMFPGYTDTMHQANEFVPVDFLVDAAAIYADAIYQLIK